MSERSIALLGLINRHVDLQMEGLHRTVKQLYINDYNKAFKKRDQSEDHERDNMQLYDELHNMKHNHPKIHQDYGNHLAQIAGKFGVKVTPVQGGKAYEISGGKSMRRQVVAHPQDWGDHAEVIGRITSQHDGEDYRS